jgi:hypothetical protein
VRLVTVNMFDTVYNRVTWDCHADAGLLGSTLQDYRDTLCPMFDQAYTALLEDLHQRGMLESTLVVVCSKRSLTNSPTGRKPSCWTTCVAAVSRRLLTCRTAWSCLTRTAGARQGPRSRHAEGQPRSALARLMADWSTITHGSGSSGGMYQTPYTGSRWRR